MSDLAAIHAAGGEVGGSADVEWQRLIRAHGLRAVVRAVAVAREQVRIVPLTARMQLGDRVGAESACPLEARRDTTDMLALIRASGPEGISPQELRGSLGISQGQYYHLFGQIRHLVHGAGSNQSRRVVAKDAK